MTTLTQVADAPSIDPLDALAAMTEVEQSLIVACEKLSALTEQLRSAGPQARVDTPHQFEELVGMLASYSEEIRYLAGRYRDGE